MPPKSALQALIDRYVGDSPRRIADMEAARLREAIAYDLRRLRIQAGLTQTQLAEKADLDQPSVSLYENSRRCTPSLATLVHIATALGMRLEIRWVPREEGR